ncbi:protoporphyrinogen oxidase [Haloglycomyces albus]|uniref:protoporphyrinogen oxidase n=1 Tax=Haloglycomyces albus TaxID=526067 RepID=UPI0004B9FD49|nr:protoporphyrinogen oxidase [Haloglycomyces albus]
MKPLDVEEGVNASPPADATIMNTQGPKRILVIGGGITGLTAAHRLRENLGPDADITIAEHSDRLGGRIKTVDFAGYRIESGAESMLATRPETTELAKAVGLSERLVAPAPVPAGLSFNGQLHDLPTGTFMGIPQDPDDVAEIVGTQRPQVSDNESNAPLLGAEEDISVGELVRTHYGDEVLNRLVTPLLGGVYAGDPDQLSLEATMPALAAALREHSSVPSAIEAVKSQRSTNSQPRSPFATVKNGLSALITATAAASGANINLGVTVRELHQTPYGWDVVAGPVANPFQFSADAVIIATPAYVTARLLKHVAPETSTALDNLKYASIALATFAFDEINLPERSGFLVAEGKGLVKASTFITHKWPHIRSRRPIVRVSLGRIGDVAELHQSSDDDLVQAALGGLAEHLGQTVPEPIESRLDRHNDAMPQYSPGHVQRMQGARAELAGKNGLAIAGAAADGIGIASCIASGRRVADEISQEIHIEEAG